MKPTSDQPGKRENTAPESESTARRILPPGALAIVLRLGAGMAVILLGIGIFHALKSMKQPPQLRERVEPELVVEGQIARHADFPVTIRGFGEVTARAVVEIAPQVAGRVTRIHDRLDVGEIIPAGEILFTIDASDYEITLREIEATLALQRASLERLNREFKIDEERWATLERSETLTRNELTRVRNLFEQHQVGTLSGVEQAERTYNATKEQADLLRRAITAYPLHIKEAERRIAAVEAQRDRAQLNVARCTVAAPFTARVTATDIEQSEYVQPGQTRLVLTDDSVLEIHAALDSRDTQRWLRFAAESDTPSPWVAELEPVECIIRWTEQPDGTRWTGRLQRVVRFEPETRTVTVAIRISGNETRPTAGQSLPLVTGMFCSVDIPGRPLKHVVRLPRHAVTFENEVYLCASNRLKTAAVTVERTQDGYAYVSDGLREGDQVILTRLVNPLEHARLVWKTLENPGL